MKQIDDIIKKDTNTTELEIENLTRQALRDPDLLAFIKKHNINRSILYEERNLLLAYIVKKRYCHNCSGLDACRQSVSGKMPVFELNEGRIELEYQACAYLKNAEEVGRGQTNLFLHGINPQDLVDCKIYVNIERGPIMELLKQFLANYPAVKNKGLYLHGPYGCGKSFLMADFAKKLAQKGHDVLFIYYPDLTRLIKNAIGSPDFEATINQLKQIEILIFDDFGGESPSGFIRDEVLMPILQERMVFHRPLFVTSNLGPDQLKNHFGEDAKFFDQHRAQRVIERLMTLMDFVQLNDRNYRS